MAADSLGLADAFLDLAPLTGGPDDPLRSTAAEVVMKALEKLSHGVFARCRRDDDARKEAVAVILFRIMRKGPARVRMEDPPDTDARVIAYLESALERAAWDSGPRPGHDALDPVELADQSTRNALEDPRFPRLWQDLLTEVCGDRRADSIAERWESDLEDALALVMGRESLTTLASRDAKTTGAPAATAYEARRQRIYRAREVLLECLERFALSPDSDAEWLRAVRAEFLPRRVRRVSARAPRKEST